MNDYSDRHSAAAAKGAAAPCRAKRLSRLLRALGVINPTVRELVELQYEFQEPFILDSTKIAAKLDVHATPLDHALADTLATYQANPS